MDESTRTAFDDPKRRLADDRLERAGFAQLIARMLVSQSPDVPTALAITGDWGSGKTSVANFVLEAVDTHIKIVIFEPWMVGTSEALLVISAPFWISAVEGAPGIIPMPLLITPTVLATRAAYL